MRAFGFLEKPLGIFGIVLAFGDAGLAIPKPRVAAVESQRAGELAPVASAGLVRAGHGNGNVTVTDACSLASGKPVGRIICSLFGS